MATQQTADLLKLLHICAPLNEPLAKASYLEEIEMMDEYRELSRNKAFRQIFEQYYSSDKLSELGIGELRQVAALMPSLPTVLQDIVFSLKNGNAPAITAEDYPDFYNADSIGNLHRKLAQGGSPNYTNIEAERFMDIFLPETVKDGRTLFYQMPAEAKDFEQTLPQMLSGRPYCIAKRELDFLEEDYEKRTTVVARDTRKMIIEGVRNLFIKAAIAVFIMAVLSVVVSLLKINETMEGMIYALWLLISLVFLIGG